MLCLPGIAAAGSITAQQKAVPFTAVVSVDQTATPITLDFNNDNVADYSGLLTLWNKTGNGVYCVDRGTATVGGAPLEAGQTFTFNYRGTQTRIVQVSCVTDTGNAAILHIWAIP